ncbi:MAG: EAL domain-containing response regulator [Holophagales bacterium]|nr:EAL domain-containing response regulator [Holophagales bacterium]
MTAASGELALELLDTGSFDTLLTDVRMPGLDGVALLQAARKRDADLPVILVTGCPAADLSEDTMEIAPAGLLLKPVSGDLLVRTVARTARFCRLARFAHHRASAEPLPEPQLLQGPGVVPAFSRALSSLYLAWQPIVRSTDGATYGHEAFVRTLEPTLENPATFFGVAQDLDRLVDLGRAVRRTASSEIAGFPGETLFVNVHPSELHDDALSDPDSPLSALARSIVLEVSDRAPLKPGGAARARLQKLRRLGFRIAIDDLGSGSTDPGTLAWLEPEFAKLDIPLVSGLDTDPAKQTRVHLLTKTLHELGIAVVAEGIETTGEREAAIDLEVDFLQGFLFGRPKPVSALLSPT